VWDSELDVQKGSTVIMCAGVTVSTIKLGVSVTGAVGGNVGCILGIVVGSTLGMALGAPDGIQLDTTDGSILGMHVGCEGEIEGSKWGPKDGHSEKLTAQWVSMW
jgi:hypothetical protein